MTEKCERDCLKYAIQNYVKGKTNELACKHNRISWRDCIVCVEDYFRGVLDLLEKSKSKEI